MLSAIVTQLREREQTLKAHAFCADVRREIASRAFTIADRDIPSRRITVVTQDKLDVVPVEGHPGVAHIWLQCLVKTDPHGMYFLRVKTVDEMISAITISEVTATPGDAEQPLLAEDEPPAP